MALDLTFCLGESLFDGQSLSILEHLVRKEAPLWASDTCIWRDEEKKRRSTECFAIDVQSAATERGALYDTLVKRHGAQPFARRSGSVELRGANDAMVIVLNLDEHVFAPSSGRWLWGNTITVQIREPLPKAGAAVGFARQFAASACADLSPWYAHGHLLEEWDRKNISREGGGMMAQGVDISRYLPGLYWLNFFGQPYLSLIGKQRLLNAPGCETTEIDKGVLLYMSPMPDRWNTPEYQSTEASVTAYLGEEHFFNPHVSSRRTVAPDFGLESLPRNARFT